MAGHGSPPPEDRAHHPGRKVGRQMTEAEALSSPAHSTLDLWNRVGYHVQNYLHNGPTYPSKLKKKGA